MNFVFVSPHFPDSYYLFCQGLKTRNVNVLGLGDTPYVCLREEVKNSLTEYYYVSDMEDYDQMLRAVAYFTFRYGKIDWIESNNEHWLSTDAKLRKDFNISHGISTDQLHDYQSKEEMKKYYKKADVPCARYCILKDIDYVKSFINKVGYPIVIKPDKGVGASKTYKICNEEQLNLFYQMDINEKMIIEEYVNGDICSFDGITNSKNEILFCTSHMYGSPLMDVVNDKEEVSCYSKINVPVQLLDMGKRVVKSFDTKCRFFHFEFFILKEDHTYLGKKGDYVGLEVNMRAPGGFIPDLINFANDFNIFDLWAEMIVSDTFSSEDTKKYSSGFAGRWKETEYAYTIEELKEKYDENILNIIELPDLFKDAMGDEVIIARFTTEKEMMEFIKLAQKHKEKNDIIEM